MKLFAEAGSLATPGKVLNGNSCGVSSRAGFPIAVSLNCIYTVLNHYEGLQNTQYPLANAIVSTLGEETVEARRKAAGPWRTLNKPAGSVYPKSMANHEDMSTWPSQSGL